MSSPRCSHFIAKGLRVYIPTSFIGVRFYEAGVYLSGLCILSGLSSVPHTEVAHDKG